MTFQVVLSSDGNASFAALIYKNPHRVEEFNGPLQVGFDAGDKTRGVNIVGDHSVYGTPLQGVNLFRIDGNVWPRDFYHTVDRESIAIESVLIREVS